MNLYGFATGTNDYSLNLSERDSLRVGDIVTVAFLNGNTGASTLSVNGNAPLPLLRNESAMSSGDLVALTLYQFCFTGAAFKQDVQAAAGATTDASLLTSGTLAEARLPNNINATRVADGSISNTEFQYLNNVSSNIQGQLDALTTAINGEASTRAAADSGLTSSIAGKANTSHTHSGADITTGTVPVAAIPTAIPAASIANGTVDNTEFQTLNGVTSNIQNQLDNKQPSATGTPDGTKFLGDDNSWKNVSATDSTKVPLAGGTWTGAMLGSNGLDGGAAEIAGGSAANTTNGARLRVGGVNNGTLPGGVRIDLGNVGGAGFLVNSAGGTRQGGFPLTPSDMPVQKCRVSRTGSNQTGNSGGYAHNTVNMNTVDINTGSNLTWASGVGTVVNTGVYDILTQVDVTAGECFVAIKVNSTIVASAYVNGATAYLGQASVRDFSLTAGDTVQTVVAFGGATDINYQHTALGISDGNATFMQLSRKQ